MVYGASSFYRSISLSHLSSFAVVYVMLAMPGSVLRVPCCDVMCLALQRRERILQGELVASSFRTTKAAVSRQFGDANLRLSAFLATSGGRRRRKGEEGGKVLRDGGVLERVETSARLPAVGHDGPVRRCVRLGLCLCEGGDCAAHTLRVHHVVPAAPILP